MFRMVPAAAQSSAELLQVWQARVGCCRGAPASTNTPEAPLLT